MRVSRVDKVYMRQLAGFDCDPDRNTYARDDDDEVSFGTAGRFKFSQSFPLHSLFVTLSASGAEKTEG
jgi:hypothetical protein